MNIEKGDDKGKKTPGLVPIVFAVMGPYTNSVTFTLKSKDGKPEYTIINSSTIKIAKTIHASIGTGFVYSSLKNPTNIRAVQLTGNDSTLVADNPTGNASLCIMATLYPWGRNSLLMPSRLIKDRLGVVLGTNIASSKNNFKNLFLGLQYDFAIGGSVICGADIADRQKIRGVDYHSFTFGDSKFQGKLDDKLYKEVGVGLFIGIQVDSRIFYKMFPTNP